MVTFLRPLPAASLRLLVFDLDGTLIDSCADICNSVNGMLLHFGRQPLPPAVIAGYIGDGAHMLVQRAFGDPDDQALVSEALAYFLAYYREHLLDNTRAYPGVLDALSALKCHPNGEPRRMAVLTNKPVGPARKICDGLGLSPFFAEICGGNSFSTKKPDPQGLLSLIRSAGVTGSETLMIGDSEVDVLTARNAGAWALGCRFGLSPHSLETAVPDCLVDSPSEWTEALEAARIEAN